MTETYINPHQITHIAGNHLSLFQFLDNTCEVKFLSHVLSYKETVNIHSCRETTDKSIFVMRKSSFMNVSLEVLL